MAQLMPGAIRTMGHLNGLGGLSCPAPPDDRDGIYRVGLDEHGRPEIQRQNGDGAWQPVPEAKAVAPQTGKDSSEPGAGKS